MNQLKRLFALAAVLSVVMALSAYTAYAESPSGTTIYGDELESKGFYERMVELPNGDLLATWCRKFPVITNWRGMKSFYFFKSSDKGKTWEQFSELDPEAYEGISRSKVGMPGLYVLPRQLGEYPAGTVLFAVSDWNAKSEYCLHIWRSTDDGQTWELHSSLAPRGINPGSVWEPEFAVSADGRLVCYYSDETQKGYDQCIAYEVSEDGGETWGNYTIVAGACDLDWRRGVDEAMWRPGMPRVLRLSDGTYFMAYENIAAGHDGVITCRTSEDGLSWGDPTQTGTPVAAGEAMARQCPEIACVDDGSRYGRIVLRGMNDTCAPSQCFTSADAGKTWQLMDAPLTAVRNESRGSGWSGTFIASGSCLYELNNAYNGSYNEIRFGSGVVYGDRLIAHGADYKLVNAATGYCIDNSGAQRMGARLILQQDTGEVLQQWHTRRLDDDVFLLLCNASGLALDVPEGSLESGVRIWQWNPNETPAQSWVFIPEQDGTYRIKNQKSGLYLEAEDQNAAGGANLIQNEYADTLTQKWRFERF